MSRCPPVSVAPMMDVTDAHTRWLYRRISRRVLLYTEMVTAQALDKGDAPRLLAYDPVEHPIALQLGGLLGLVLGGWAMQYQSINSLTATSVTNSNSTATTASLHSRTVHLRSRLRGLPAGASGASGEVVEDSSGGEDIQDSACSRMSVPLTPPKAKLLLSENCVGCVACCNR